MAYTYSGHEITPDIGSPEIEDLAVQSMRIARYGGAGAGIPFWPVGLHSMLVADLLEETGLEVHGLIHDGSEIVVGEVPYPMKTKEQKAQEEVIQARMYAHFGVTPPTEEEHRIIKLADQDAYMSEVSMGCSGQGYMAKFGGLTDQSVKKINPSGFALQRMAYYYRELMREGYGPAWFNLFSPVGRWPAEFKARLTRAILQHKEQNAKSGTATVSGT